MSARLDEIEYRLASPMVTYKENATEDAPALVAALRTVLDLHHRTPAGLCAECTGNWAGDSHPCPTYRAVESSLGGEG